MTDRTPTQSMRQLMESIGEASVEEGILDHFRDRAARTGGQAGRHDTLMGTKSEFERILAELESQDAEAIARDALSKYAQTRDLMGVQTGKVEPADSTLTGNMGFPPDESYFDSRDYATETPTDFTAAWETEFGDDKTHEHFMTAMRILKSRYQKDVWAWIRTNFSFEGIKRIIKGQRIGLPMGYLGWLLLAGAEGPNDPAIGWGFWLMFFSFWTVMLSIGTTIKDLSLTRRRMARQSVNILDHGDEFVQEMVKQHDKLIGDIKSEIAKLDEQLGDLRGPTET